MIEGTLPVQWADFPSSDPIPNTAKNDAFFADLSKDAPIVYLNSAFEATTRSCFGQREAATRRVGASRGRVSPDRDLGVARDVQRRGREHRAQRGEDEEGESAEPEFPATNGSARFFRRLSPACSTKSESEVLRKIATARTGDESREVQTQAAAAIGRLVDKAAGSLKKRIQQLSGTA